MSGTRHAGYGHPGFSVTRIPNAKDQGIRRTSQAHKDNMVVIMLFRLGKTTRSAEQPITPDGTAHARILQDDGGAGRKREILCEPVA